MRKLFLFLVVLFLSFQQVTLAAIKEMTSTPDSVYLFSFATSGDDGRSGLRFAWSTDKENWFEIGRNYGYLRCDYSRWGSQKKMLDPYLKQSPDGEWICTWKLNDRDGYGQATSKDLINWTSQKYPRTTPDFDGVRVKAIVAGEEQKGNINRVAWTLVDGLDKNYGWNQYRNSLHGERPVQDGERFAGLKPVKATVTVQPEGAKAISDVLLGAFFEDINYSADGGLYAELIQNRDFEYDPSDREGDKNWNSTHSWALKGEKTTFTIDTTDPIHINNPHYAVLNVEQPGAALENTGFDGIALNTGEKYDFSIFARVPQGKSNKLQVRLVDGKGNVCGETSLTVSSRQWKTYKAVITAKATADTHLEIIPQSVGELNLDMISLFPQNTFKGRKNGLRKDLAQVLADIHPRFIRFPGGCVAHGDGLKNIYQWKNTVGPLEARKAQRNLWGYHQSMGLGYFEYFQFCEDIGAEPLPVLAAGVPCQNSACHGDLRGGQQGGIPMSEMGAYIQDILDLIEWANGDAKKTKWGKVRAEAGHPKPFNLKYIGIGNEDLITDIFEERFTMIFNANKDFTDIEGEPKPLFLPENKKSCIDGDIIYKDGLYHLFYKTEGNGNGIKKATTSSLTSGQWTESDDYKQQTKDPVEGSGIFPLVGSDKYILMYDVYTKGKYQFTESSDLEHFKVIDHAISMDFHPRHGTVIPITPKELKRLFKAYGKPEGF
jgi:hypothetical protein